MDLQEWLALSDAQRLERQKEWLVYEDGYWHALVAEAATRLRSQITDMPHVRDINYGVYHGGTLILGVVTDLAYPDKVGLPNHYLGFPVLQFCGGGKLP